MNWKEFFRPEKPKLFVLIGFIILNFLFPIFLIFLTLSLDEEIILNNPISDSIFSFLSILYIFLNPLYIFWDKEPNILYNFQEFIVSLPVTILFYYLVSCLMIWLGRASRNTRIKMIVIAIVVSAGIAGIVIFKTSRLAQVSHKPADVFLSAMSQSSTDTANWKTYTTDSYMNMGEALFKSHTGEKAMSLSFKYPPNWKIVTSKEFDAYYKELTFKLSKDDPKYYPCKDSICQNSVRISFKLGMTVHATRNIALKQQKK